MNTYTSRILAALAGHAPVELARFTRTITRHDIAAVTNGLSSAWEVFAEYVTPDRHTITPRIRYFRPDRADYSNGIKLKITPRP